MEFMPRSDWKRILMEGEVAGPKRNNLAVVLQVLEESDIVFPGLGAESVSELALKIVAALGVSAEGIPVGVSS